MYEFPILHDVSVPADSFFYYSFYSYIGLHYEIIRTDPVTVLKHNLKLRFYMYGHAYKMQTKCGVPV